MSPFVIALIISVIVLIVKLVERYYAVDPTPVKILVRDAIVVYLSSVCTLYGTQYYMSTFGENASIAEPPVFTDNPDF